MQISAKRNRDREGEREKPEEIDKSEKSSNKLILFREPMYLLLTTHLSTPGRECKSRHFVTAELWFASQHLKDNEKLCFE